MKARIYALALIALGSGLFVSVSAANLIIDPVGIFGTSPLPPHESNANERYRSFAAFKGNERLDSVLFGSSRGRAMPLGELARTLGTAGVASFVVNGGVLADHLPVLDYLARDPARRVRTVFVLLDVDAMGNRPPTNSGPGTYLAPDVTGENTLRFWWKNLTGVTVLLWRNALREAFPPGRENSPVLPTRPSANPGESAVSADDPPSVSADLARQLGLASLPERKPGGPEQITERRMYREDIERWRRMVELCRAASIRLVAAFTPMRRSNLDRYQDFSGVIADFAAFGPVWDFSRFDRLADDDRLWGDESHFSPAVSRLMLRRIAGKSVPPDWEGFGRLHGAPAAAVTQR
jgi:hypothetical protein